MKEVIKRKYAPLNACQICGAIVPDGMTNRHTEWHNKNEPDTAMPSTLYRGVSLLSDIRLEEDPTG